MPRSISTPPTLALARRRSMSLRMARSSWSSVAYSLSAYHFADQVRLVPRRKPYGWTLCPMSGLPFFEDDGDVGHRLVDGEGSSLGSRLPALEGGALVGVGLHDHEVLGREVAVVLGVRGRACDLDPAPADRRRDEVCLAGGPAEVLGGGRNAHDLVPYRIAVERSVFLSCPRNVRVGANSPSR